MIAVLLSLAGCPGPEASDRTDDTDGVVLASSGKPTVTIRVGPSVLAAGDPRFTGNPSRYAGQDNPWRWTEDQRISAAAHDLADLLGRTVCRSPDCRFAVEAYAPESVPGQGEIRIGRPEDFGLDSPFRSTDLFDREQFLVRTGRDGVVLALGAEAGGVEDAVWELARALGYRYYLPTPRWEILPEAPGGTLALPAIDVLGRPGFVNRRLAAAGNRAEGRDLQAWATRNGFVGSFQSKGVEGQYGPIYDAAADWFGKNPRAVSASSRPKPGGKTTKVKFCPSYTDRRGESVADVVARTWALPRLAITDPTKFDNTISRDALPLHHGDSALWAGCAPADRGGATPADRAVALANGVVERLGDRLGDRVVSVMGYREPFPGPLHTRVDPRVYVWLYGNGYLGTPFEDAVAAWRKAGARHFGTYAYWTSPTFQVPDNGAPYLAPGEVAQQLVALPGQGFSSLWIESDGGWGLGGLWKWLLLDVARAPGPDPVERRTQDVLAHAFPPEARPHVARVLEQFDLSTHRFLLSTDLVSELYSELGAARAASDGAARERVEDLLVYVRHLDLYLQWRQGGAYDPFLIHAYCTDDRRMTDAELLWRQTPEETQQAWLRSHGGRGPREFLGSSPCRAPDFDGWIRGRPKPELDGLAWWPEVEGGYARATRFPGEAKVGVYEGDIHGNPRDTRLWTVWVDPAEGLTVSQACQGIHDRTTGAPEVVHLTSRLLGHSALELRDAETGALACRATLGPDRTARDLVFRRGATRVNPSSKPVKSWCKTEPRTLELDTGTPDGGAEASCDAAVFSEAGLYTLDTRNHRTGLDYDQLVGRVWASRWESPRTPNAERMAEMGARYRYFYVPEGTGTVALWASGQSCTLVRDGVRAHDVDLGTGGPGYRRVPTKVGGARHDGEIWAFSACHEVYLVNVPPVVAPKAEMLLVPCSFVRDRARAADVTALGVDPGDCAPAGR